QGEATLATANAPVVYNDTNFIEDFLNIIAELNIAFLLLSLGSLGIFIELLHPGTIFAGVFGVISLLLGFFALSVLPFNWAGVALILFAFLLFGLEMFITSHGILGIGGAVAVVFGGLILTSDNPPEFQVSRWLVFGLAAVLATFCLVIVANIIRIRRMPPRMRSEVKIVQEYERGVICRLGRLVGARGPGLFFILPFVERMVKVDLRVVTMDVPRQDVITKDNVTVKVDAVVYFRVVNPEDAVVKIMDY